MENTKKAILTAAFLLAGMAAKAQDMNWIDTAPLRGTIGVISITSEKGSVLAQLFNSISEPVDSVRIEFESGAVESNYRFPYGFAYIRKACSECSRAVVRIVVYRGKDKEIFEGEKLKSVTL